MKRSRSQIIDAEAQAIFVPVIPSVHVCREQPKSDYGIDYEIELFAYNENIQNWETTGFIFKVQLKGTENPHELADGDRIAFSFDMDKGEYLVEQIEIPAVIVLVDTKNERIFWTHVQGNKLLENAYGDAKQNGQGSFTIYFDKQNSLPKTWNSLVAAMFRCAETLALRRVARIKPPRYAEYVEDIDEIDPELVHFHQKIDIANSKKLRRLISKNLLDQAETLISQILGSEERSVEAKFDAFLCTEPIFVRNAPSLMGFAKANYDVELANNLKELTSADNVSPDLKILARGYELVAIIHYCSVLDLQLYRNWKVNHEAFQEHQDSVESFWYFGFLPLERLENVNRLLDTLDVLDEYVLELISNRYWQYVPEFLDKTSFGLLFFLQRLVEEGNTKAADELERQIIGFINSSLIYVKHFDSSPQADEIARRSTIIYFQLITIFRYDLEHIDRLFIQAKEIAAKVKDLDTRQSLEVDLDQLIHRLKSSQEENRKINWEVLEEYYRHQAQALGIDLSLATLDLPMNDKRYWDSQIAWIINLGLRDMNPTRVLKNCKHLIYRFWGGVGVPAQMLQLPSARMKEIGCIKHTEHGTIAQYSLDEVYESFRSKYCVNCPDVMQHDHEWEYTPEWHQQQGALWEAAQKEHRRKKQDND